MESKWIGGVMGDEGAVALGRRVRAARRARGMTQRDLAAKAQISRDSLVKLERAQRYTRPATLEKVAKALGMDFEDLLEAGSYVSPATAALVAGSPPGEYPPEGELGEGAAGTDAATSAADAEDRGEEGDIVALARERARREGVSLNAALRMMFQEYAIISRHSPLPTRSLPAGAPRERRKVMSRPDAAAAAVNAARGE